MVHFVNVTNKSIYYGKGNPSSNSHLQSISFIDLMLPDLVKKLQVKNNDLFASALFQHWGKTTRKLVVIQLSSGCCKKWVNSMEVLKVLYPEIFSVVLRNTCCKKFWKCIKVNPLLVLIFTTFTRIQEAGSSGVFIDNFQQIFTHFWVFSLLTFNLPIPTGMQFSNFL